MVPERVVVGEAVFRRDGCDVFPLNDGVFGRHRLSSCAMRQISFYHTTKLTGNLQDVFGENDPARRRAAINEIFTEDCVFYDPTGGVYRGRDEIDRIAGGI